MPFSSSALNSVRAPPGEVHSIPWRSHPQSSTRPASSGRPRSARTVVVHVCGRQPRTASGNFTDRECPDLVQTHEDSRRLGFPRVDYLPSPTLPRSLETVVGTPICRFTISQLRIRRPEAHILQGSQRKKGPQALAWGPSFIGFGLIGVFSPFARSQRAPQGTQGSAGSGVTSS